MQCSMVAHATGNVIQITEVECVGMSSGRGDDLVSVFMVHISSGKEYVWW